MAISLFFVIPLSAVPSDSKIFPSMCTLLLPNPLKSVFFSGKHLKSCKTTGFFSKDTIEPYKQSPLRDATNP